MARTADEWIPRPAASVLRQRLGRLAAWVAILSHCAAIGVGAESDPASDRLARLETRAERQEAEAALRRGATTFARACAACHGRRGEGDGPGAADLDPPPRDLTAPRIRFRSTPSGSAARDEDLERTIRRGLPGSSMPAFGELFSDQQLADLVAFVQSLQAGDDAPPPQPLTLAAPPPATPDLLRDGRALYLLTGCWRCHGSEGAGDGPSAPFLTDEQERPMRSTDFRRDPFKGGREPLDVVRALRTGLNGTPMPSYDEAMLIAREDVGDVAALEGRLTADASADIERFLRASPTRAELQAMSEVQRDELRDRRMAALAHYVLSLERRRGSWVWTFEQRPELEGRRP